MSKITREDIVKIGEVAQHCDLNKLNIAISEAEAFDLSGLFCENWNTISKNWEEIAYTDLINGSSFQGCNGTTRQEGLKRVLAYYAYSRYLLINNFNDTPNGSVDKSNDFSMPKSYREIKSFADRYRTMGYEAYQRVMAYLCVEKEQYQDLELERYCKPCGCNGICGNKTKAKGYGIKGSIISKHY